MELIWAPSVHTVNRGKDILILGKGPTQGLNHTLATATQYSINFTRLDIKLTRYKTRHKTLHYNGSNSFLFVNVTKTYQFKAKDFEF